MKGTFTGVLLDSTGMARCTTTARRLRLRNNVTSLKLTDKQETNTLAFAA